jgi:ADP-heptose:LPS heptosyltransferase
MDSLKPVEHKIRGIVPRLFSVFFKRGRNDFKNIDPAKIRKVLFLRPDLFGDTVCSLPVFDNLRRAFPHIQQAIVCSPRNLPLIKDDPRFDRVFVYTKVIWSDIRKIMAMRRERFDVVFDMIADDSVTTLFLSQLCAPGAARIGINKKRFSAYYDATFDYDAIAGEHIVDLNLRLLTPLGLDPAKLDPYAPPFIDAAESGKVEQFLKKLQVGMGNTLIGYNMSSGKPSRIWQAEKSRQLIERILAEMPSATIVLVTVPNERGRADELLKHFKQSVVQVPPNLSILDVSALISRFDLLITPDTSLLHVARSFKVPVVGLYPYKMRNFHLWRPYGQDFGAVMSGIDDNVFDITVDQVVTAFHEALAHSGLEAR